jgi:hypothetical protein
MRKSLLPLGIAFSFVGGAAADPVTLTFTGTIDFVHSVYYDPLGFPAATAGAPFSFSWTLTSLSGDVNPSPTQGNYNPTGSYTLSTSSGSVTHRATLTSVVVFDNPRESLARYDAVAPNPPNTFLELFFEGGPDWLDSDLLPTVATLEAASSKRFIISTLVPCCDGQEFDIGPVFGGNVLRVSDGASPAPIPEPSSLLLLSSSLLGVAGLRGWRRRKQA